MDTILEPSRIRWILTITASVFLLLGLAVELDFAASTPLIFDDAYMYYRYALNLPEGWGIWNRGDAPTYGLTSQLWLVFVSPLPLLPVPVGAALAVTSWIVGVLGLLIMCIGLVRRGRSPWIGVLALAAAVALVTSPQFAFQLRTGMDTMLAFSANVILVLCLHSYQTAPDRKRAIALGLCTFLAVMARMDGGICAFGAPLLAWLLGPRPRRHGDLPWLIGMPLLLLGIFMAACTLYYGVPVPLSFFAKSASAYVGFQSPENPIGYMLDFLACVLPFALILCIVPGRRSLLISCMVPLALTVLYFLTVKQVMGWSGRYYMPFLPYVVIPAVLALDQAISERRQIRYSRLLMVAAPVALLSVTLFSARQSLVASYRAATLPAAVPLPLMEVSAKEPLPEKTWGTGISGLADHIVSRLPEGSKVAASEVGYLAASAPQVKIIDLVGLNDTRVALRGLHVDGLVGEAPDLIWLPHPDYTGLRADILGNREFREQYIVIAGAFNYGLAIRRDSPRRKQIEALIADAWRRLYSGRNLSDYVVQTVS